MNKAYVQRLTKLCKLFIKNDYIMGDFMEEKIKNTMRFYLLATKLKYKIRSGWDEKHWNIKSERIESIAEHVY